MTRSFLCTLIMVGGVARAAEDQGMSMGGAARTTFSMRIENVSTPATLRSSSGVTAPAPNSPGLWIVHTARRPLFTAGRPDRGLGLEAQAEDGDPTRLVASVRGRKGVVASGVFDTPVGDAKPGPALPGKAFEVTFEARPGERLTVVTMFGQSNDLFYAPGDEGIALFDRGQPIRGDITSRLFLWDAGTEVNEEPGFGPNQAPRQAAPNTGPTEHEPVRRIEEVKDGFTYPRVNEAIRVTITPTPSAAEAMRN